jgi:hypothetical protein
MTHGDVHKAIMNATIDKIWRFQNQLPANTKLSELLRREVQRTPTFMNIILRDANMVSNIARDIFNED